MNYAQPQGIGGTARGAYIEPAASQHPIPDALSRLGMSLKELDNTAAMLASRLDVVMLPILPAPTGKGESLAAAPPPVSRQTDEINAMRRHVETMCEQLQD